MGSSSLPHLCSHPAGVQQACSSRWWLSVATVEPFLTPQSHWRVPFFPQMLTAQKRSFLSASPSLKCSPQWLCVCLCSSTSSLESQSVKALFMYLLSVSTTRSRLGTCLFCFLARESGWGHDKWIMRCSSSSRPQSTTSCWFCSTKRDHSFVWNRIMTLGPKALEMFLYSSWLLVFSLVGYRGGGGVLNLVDTTIPFPLVFVCLLFLSVGKHARVPQHAWGGQKTV